MKPAALRPQAEIDLIEAACWYEDQGSAMLAERFFDAARAAMENIERMPGQGSLRLGQLAGLDDLRSWPLDRFPLRWFYFERADFVDVVRRAPGRRGDTLSRPRLTGVRTDPSRRRATLFEVGGEYRRSM